MKQSLDVITLEEKVTSIIREAIFTQQLKPGERLVQDELAGKLGVSRMPVREALRSLEREGLVEMLPHKGAVVIGIRKDDVEELYFLRSQLEGITVQKSMYFLTDDDLDKLNRLVEHMDQDIEMLNIDSFVFHNKQFHLLLQKGCNWKKVKILSKQFIEGYPAYVPSLVPEMIKESNKEHKEMVKALTVKDPIKLRQLVEQHIMRAGNMLTQLLE